jgi:hypothetical protein
MKEILKPNLIKADIDSNLENFAYIMRIKDLYSKIDENKINELKNNFDNAIALKK